ncbi:hypothetical protein LSAT2_018432 [Lamellibrachia satsuma]|nr:hypothetical protein LSAT2_018432 [Lamellibrachia satsuma]
MPKYYCDYCDTYLTHDSPSVRKTHCNGRKHKENVRVYYQKWLEEQVQQLVDDTTAAFKAGSKSSSGGAAIPPPASMPAPSGPMPGHMGMMGPGPGGPMPPMMAGMRPPMGPMGHMGGPMAPPLLGHMGMRPMMAGPPRLLPTKK